jgi:hypothetical protein
MNARKLCERRIKVGVTTLVAAAVIGVPVAHGATDGALLAKAAAAYAATQSSGSYIGHPGGPGFSGTDVALPSSGSYIGHPGGPGGAGPVLSTDNGQPSGSFDWSDASVGAGFILGVGILYCLVLVLRRRGMIAQPSA